MWAYVDETGNTGNRIFDDNQPYFMTAGMITRSNFDAVHTDALRVIALKVGGKALHAGELGVGRIELIAEDLLKVVKRADARFFLARLEKRYLAVSKVYDTYFDAGENLAVPWHVYWIRQLRLMMMFRLSMFVITEDIAQTVWECVTAPSEEKSKAAFVGGAKAMLANVNLLPDERSKAIVSDALQWAIDNPEKFTTHIRERAWRNSHSPNFVAFTALMRGLDALSRKAGRPIREIVHDRQDEFRKGLTNWHEMFSQPRIADEKLHWPGDVDVHHVGQTSGSNLRFSTEENSAGLQVVDVVLWLFKRLLNDQEIGPASGRLMQRVLLRGQQDDLSFAGVGAHLETSIEAIMNSPMTDQQIDGGREMVARHEQDRLEQMRKYAEEKALARY